MAGRRQDVAKPSRPQRRASHWEQELEAAPTIEAELNVAFDWWRSAVRRLADRDTRVITLARQLARQARAMNGGSR